MLLWVSLVGTLEYKRLRKGKKKGGLLMEWGGVGWVGKSLLGMGMQVSATPGG